MISIKCGHPNLNSHIYENTTESKHGTVVCTATLLLSQKDISLVSKNSMKNNLWTVLVENYYERKIEKKKSNSVHCWAVSSNSGRGLFGKLLIKAF